MATTEAKEPPTEMPRDFSERLTLMDQYALRAGEYAMQGFSDGTDIEVQIKPDGTSVTKYDILLNRMLIDWVKDALPEDSVFGEEESHLVDEGTGWQWVVDPLDGTSDYIRHALTGTPGACSTTVMVSVFEPQSPEPCMGVVYTPFLNSRERYLVHEYATSTAMRHRYGASAGAVSELEGVESYKLFNNDPENDRFDRFVDSLPGSAKRRSMPSIGLAACRAACGGSDLVVFAGTSPHDIAPSMYVATRIAQYSGAWVSDLNGNTMDRLDLRGNVDGLIVASSPGLGEEVVDLLQ